MHIDDNADLYLASIEFAIFAMVLSYSRTQPQTIIEHCFALVVLIVLGAVYACELRLNS